MLESRYKNKIAIPLAAFQDVTAGRNRLKTYAGKNMEYDIKGNITQKNDAGVNFVYNTPGKPYAISGANLGTNTSIPLRSQSVTYTSFERPAGISENGCTATFTYIKITGLSGSRLKNLLK